MTNPEVKKERYRVLTISTNKWENSAGFNSPIIAHAVRNKTINHTDLQRNYFKKIN